MAAQVEKLAHGAPLAGWLAVVQEEEEEEDVQYLDEDEVDFDEEDDMEDLDDYYDDSFDGG